jgi:hypothetical protein
MGDSFTVAGAGTGSPCRSKWEGGQDGSEDGEKLHLGGVDVCGIFADLGVYLELKIRVNLWAEAVGTSRIVGKLHREVGGSRYILVICSNEVDIGQG